MLRRLVLGSGSLSTPVVDSLASKPGSLQVVSADEHFVQTLREGGVSVERGDPADGDLLRSLPPADIVTVIGDSASVNLDVARTARRVFPDAHLVAYAGSDAVDHGASLEGIADTVVDRGQATADRVMENVGPAAARMRRLWALLGELDSLAVVAHDNPDPDAIASGVALAQLSDAAGCEATVCYYGNITHQENRAFVNLLDLDLRNLDQDEGVEGFDGVALVDHSRPGVNNQLPPETAVDIVIDHHPPRAPVDARFVDLRSDVGATSSLFVDYLEHFGLSLDGSVPTALLFGIHVDTQGFSREVSTRDFEAAAWLVRHADLGTLERIESPSISGRTLETVARAIGSRRREGSVLTSCVGEIPERDALAQAADRLLAIEGVKITLVYGVMDGTVYVSARTRGAEVDLGETMRDAFGQIGSAGGHHDMAGAQIELGVLGTADDDDSLLDIVEMVVANRFLEALESAETPSSSRYGEQDIAEAFLGVDERPESGQPGRHDEEEDSQAPSGTDSE
ncbi:MAG: DHH family phosphoesterase [Halovenus sp.]